MRPKALDLFCGAGGVSVGLARAGFEVTGVDLDPGVERCWKRGMEPYGGDFVCADALEVPLTGYDFIWASPPCQAHTSLRHLTKKEYQDLIPATRERLKASGAPLGWVIENVPGAPLEGRLLMLCGSMFGLATPDGRAEIRRHRLFESPLRFVQPECRHGEEVLTVTGDNPRNDGAQRRRRLALTITRAGINSADTPPKGMTRPQARETYSIEDARHAMGIDWMPMRHLSQAIPPAYAEYIGRQVLGCRPPHQVQLFE